MWRYFWTACTEAHTLHASAPVATFRPVRCEISALSSFEATKNPLTLRYKRSRLVIYSTVSAIQAIQLYTRLYTRHQVTGVLMIRIRSDSGLVPFPSTKKGLQGHTLVKRNLEQWTTGSQWITQEVLSHDVTCTHFGSHLNAENYFSEKLPMMMYCGSAVINRSTVVNNCFLNLANRWRVSSSFCNMKHVMLLEQR